MASPPGSASLSGREQRTVIAVPTLCERANSGCQGACDLRPLLAPDASCCLDYSPPPARGQDSGYRPDAPWSWPSVPTDSRGRGALPKSQDAFPAWHLALPIHPVGEVTYALASSGLSRSHKDAVSQATCGGPRTGG